MRAAQAMEEPPPEMTEEDYFAAAYEEELAMEEEARAATNEAPAAAPMDTAEPAEADKPKGVFDWRERDDFGKDGTNSVEEKPMTTGHNYEQRVRGRCRIAPVYRNVKGERRVVSTTQY